MIAALSVSVSVALGVTVNVLEGSEVLVKVLVGSGVFVYEQSSPHSQLPFFTCPIERRPTPFQIHHLLRAACTSLMIASITTPGSSSKMVWLVVLAMICVPFVDRRVSAF